MLAADVLERYGRFILEEFRVIQEIALSNLDSDEAKCSLKDN